MTQEELVALLKDNLKGCNLEQFLDRIIQELLTAIGNRYSFDYDKFYNWFITRKISSMERPLSFISKCVVSDIKNGLFDKPYTIEIIATTMLINEMRDNGITVYPEDTAYIDTVMRYIFTKKLLPINELAKWNKQAISFLKDKNKTTKDFVFLFNNTKVMRALDLPLKQLKEEADAFHEEWSNLCCTISKRKVTAMTDEEIKDFIKESEAYNEERH